MRFGALVIGLLAGLSIGSMAGVARAKPSKKSDVGFAALKFTQSVIEEEDRQKVWRKLVDLLGHRAGVGAAKGLKHSLALSSRQAFATKNRLRYVVEVTVEASQPAISRGWSATLSLFDIKNPAEGTQELRAECGDCDLTAFLVGELPGLVEEVGRAMSGATR